MIIIFAGVFGSSLVCATASATVSLRACAEARAQLESVPPGAGRPPRPGRRRRGEERTLLFCPSNLEKAMAAGAAAARGLARGCLAETRPSFGVTFCDCVSCCTAVHDMQQKNRARQRMCGRIARRMRAGRPPGVRRWRLGAPPRTELYFATSDAPAHEDEMAVQWRTSRVCAEARSTLAVTCRNRAAYMYR